MLREDCVENPENTAVEAKFCLLSTEGSRIQLAAPLG
jgi:hypothetical protein